MCIEQHGYIECSVQRATWLDNMQCAKSNIVIEHAVCIEQHGYIACSAYISTWLHNTHHVYKSLCRVHKILLDTHILINTQTKPTDMTVLYCCRCCPCEESLYNILQEGLYNH